ncbi:trimeric intracellular cation channel family protein [Tessaracoccus sp. MC1865]|uniref:trimeric intracellular cation channel family protein n=1 Tax=Tessaracoccus sp. MC1865 TaxID=2760310 RepID=UPI001602B6D0|nr:trimeric intracellular cation channel family protein [Tessaracoccus sp. MC1865]MBB1484444.1 trimeric intracellular cation channel family protein [Tessaracoccus sp. MC1865]QTO38451.1 trimeric intracellular cation channel family protein [Tessaracoccus sp. MC1865]
MDAFDPSVLFRFVDVAGVVANGLLGALVARRLRFDIIGFLFLAILTGLGGGMLRDVLLTTRPVAFIDPLYLVGAVSAAGVAYLVTFKGRWMSRLLTSLDMLALGCWSATGTIKALGFGLDPLPAILLGVLTAVGGGMIRDVVTGRIPVVFGGNTLYASVAVIGAAESLILTQLGYPNLGMAASILTCTVLGLLAHRYRWTLPQKGEVR